MSDELDRLRREHATMLETLTHAQSRCTAMEQELRELRGSAGETPVLASESEDEQYWVAGWLDDVSEHDTLEQAIGDARALAKRSASGGKSFVAAMRRTCVFVGAQKARFEEQDFGPCPF